METKKPSESPSEKKGAHLSLTLSQCSTGGKFADWRDKVHLLNPCRINVAGLIFAEVAGS
jgi:hypothetical protein